MTPVLNPGSPIQTTKTRMAQFPRLLAARWVLAIWDSLKDSGSAYGSIPQFLCGPLDCTKTEAPQTTRICSQIAPSDFRIPHTDAKI